MELEIEQLRLELEKEKTLRIELEEECDTLAMANVRLQNELSVFRKAGVSSCSGANAAGFHVAETTNEDGGGGGVLGFDGDGRFANKARCTIDNACGSMNVLSVAFCNGSSGADAAEVVACGGTDNCVSFYSAETGAQIAKYPLTAPVLMLDAFECLLACSMMDGSMVIINAANSQVTHLKDHAKYVVGVKWSPDGTLLATVSHDKSVNLYRVATTDAAVQAVEKVNTLRLSVTPESCCFAPAAGQTAEALAGALPCRYELVIALRDTNHLIYMDCETFKQRFVLLNENAWDTHVSITPLFLLTSPDLKCLLVATDKNMHFMTRLGESKRLKVYAGHNCGDYGKPRVSFDATGQYVYCNSENDSSVFIYDVTSGSIVGKLDGHRNIVKDVCCSRIGRLVATASFDRSIIIWHREHE